MADELAVDDVHSLYVDRGEGGHYSPETNERIAEILTDEVIEAAEVTGAGESGTDVGAQAED